MFLADVYEKTGKYQNAAKEYAKENDLLSRFNKKIIVPNYTYAESVRIVKNKNGKIKNMEKDSH